MLHLFGLGKKCLRTRVDLRFPLLTGVIEHYVLDAFNAVQKKGVEACKFRTVSHTGGLVGLVQFNIVFGILLAYASNAVIREIAHEETAPTKQNTQADTRTAMQTGEMVWA